MRSHSAFFLVNSVIITRSSSNNQLNSIVTLNVFSFFGGAFTKLTQSSAFSMENIL